MPWQPFLSVESDWFKFGNSFLIIWKRLEIVRTTFEKNRYQRGDHRAWFQILWTPPLPLTENFQMPWQPFLSVESDWFKFGNSFLIIWKRPEIVRTTFVKNRYQRGTTGPDFKSFFPPLPLTENFQMPWQPLLSVEGDRFKLRNSFLIIWKRLGIVRTTFEIIRYQRGDHRAWFQILCPPPAPPYLWQKMFKCLDRRFYQLKVIGLSSETPSWLFENVRR